MSLETINNSTILIELNKAVKMHNFYPEGHPNLDSALEKCYLHLKKLLEEKGEIAWKIDQKGFYDGKNIIAPGNQDLTALAKKAFFRRIKEITITRRVTLSDMRVFLSALKLEPDELQARGGAEAFFAESDVQGFMLNELRYEDLRRIKRELEDKRAAEEEKDEWAAKAQEKPEEKVEAGESEESEEKEKPDKQKQEDEDLALLLKRIRDERDLLRYNDLAVRIRERAGALIDEQKLDEVFPSLLVLIEHCLIHNMTDEVRSVASETLQAILTSSVIKNLVNRIGGKEDTFRTAVQQMLLRAGDGSVEPLLDAILAAPEALARRNYFNTIVLFGPRIRPQVELKLASSREWFEARQMISILGELGDPLAVDALSEAYKVNSDIRVKKEVLKSLVKLRSPRSVDMLTGALEEKEISLVNQAIISLGMLRDGSAVDVLGRIALENQESKREAIKALGLIGDRKALPYLTRILFKRVWFGKKTQDELRMLAASSLGMIGGEEAMSAIEKACAHSEGDLNNACKRILEGREKNT